MKYKLTRLNKSAKLNLYSHKESGAFKSVHSAVWERRGKVEPSCPHKLLSTYISNEWVPESIIAAEGNCVLIGVILEQHDVSHSQNRLGKQGAEPSHPSQGEEAEEGEREGDWGGREREI